MKTDFLKALNGVVSGNINDEVVISRVRSILGSDDEYVPESYTSSLSIDTLIELDNYVDLGSNLVTKKYVSDLETEKTLYKEREKISVVVQTIKKEIYLIDTKRIMLYGEIAMSEKNKMICGEVIRCLEDGGYNNELISYLNEDHSSERLNKIEKDINTVKSFVVDQVEKIKKANKKLLKLSKKEDYYKQQLNTLIEFDADNNYVEYGIKTDD